MIVEIEEGIYSIEDRLPLRKVVFTYANSKITRKLFMLGDTDSRNNKIDVIEGFFIEIVDIERLTPIEIGDMLKKRILDCFERNIQSEMPFYKSPIITRTNYEYEYL